MKQRKDLYKQSWYKKLYPEDAKRMEDEAQKKLNPDDQESIWEMIKTAILAVLIALIIRTFVAEPFNIPSGSMVPTLLVGDYLFVSKYSYGYSKYAFPLDLATFDGRIMADTPKRGDVAVFRQPKQPSIDYIKRIVGLPGDTISVKDGILYINDTAVIRKKMSIEYLEDSFGRLSNNQRYKEILPNGYAHPIVEKSDEELYDNTQTYIVPEGHFFAMGDNRDNSQDSRAMAAVGFVPMDNLVGKAQFIFFSTNGTARLTHFWEWPGAIRWNRLFNKIH